MVPWCVGHESLSREVLRSIPGGSHGGQEGQEGLDIDIPIAIPIQHVAANEFLLIILVKQVVSKAFITYPSITFGSCSSS